MNQQERELLQECQGMFEAMASTYTRWADVKKLIDRIDAALANVGAEPVAHVNEMLGIEWHKDAPIAVGMRLYGEPPNAAPQQGNQASPAPSGNGPLAPSSGSLPNTSGPAAEAAPEPLRCQHMPFGPVACPECRKVAPEPGGAELATPMANESALQRYHQHMVPDEATDPIENLRFFCSLAMKAQDWIDVEPFFDAMRAASPAKGAELARTGRMLEAERMRLRFHGRDRQERESWANRAAKWLGDQPLSPHTQAMGHVHDLLHCLESAELEIEALRAASAPAGLVNSWQAECTRLTAGLQWYANGHHHTLENDWEVEEGWYCPPNDEPWMVESGCVARALLEGKELYTDEDGELATREPAALPRDLDG